MFQDKKNVIIAILAGILLLMVGVGAKFAYDQHKALDQADAASAVDSKVIADLQTDRANRAEADLDQQKQAAALQATVHTSSDAVRYITQYVPQPAAATPNAPAQTVAIQRSDLTAAEQAKVPNAPGYVLQTQDAATATAKELIQCSADRSSLTSCRAELADSDKQQMLLSQQVTVYKDAAKGGSASKRFLKFAGCAALGAGGGAAGALTKRPLYAAVGAVGGFTACQLLF